MNYEQKYKEALERAKYLKENTDSIGAKDISYNFEYIFPELKEPEDEKIRKGLIKGLSAMRDIHKHQTFSDDAINIDDAIAWIEKQGEKSVCKVKIGKKYKCIASPRYSTFMKGNIYKPEDKFVCSLMNFYSDCFEPIEDDEQEPTDKVEPKFKAGDWITNGEYIWKVTDIKPLDYILQSQNGGVVDDTISYVDEEFHLWTIQDAKDGDVLFTTCDNINEMVFIYRGIEFDTTHCYFLYSKTNNECKTFNSVCSVKADIHPATKEQRDLLFFKMKEAGYEWDSEKKELKKIEQKSWSEEDEKMFDEVCSSIKYAEKHRITCPEKLAKLQLDWLKSIKNRVQPKQEWSKEDKEMLDSIIDCIDGLCFIDSDQLNWLKSIKPNHWKPSEEQMETLKFAANDYVMEETKKNLESLYNDLKNL